MFLCAFAASPANDELEFVKIRSRATASQKTNASNPTATINNFDNLAFDNEDSSNLNRVNRSSHRPMERPPSYDTTMRGSSAEETQAANLYYASDRQSVRSKASTRSKRSTSHQRAGHQGSLGRRHRDRDVEAARQDLPWVQITPSSSTGGVDLHLRHYP